MKAWGVFILLALATSLVVDVEASLHGGHHLAPEKAENHAEATQAAGSSKQEAKNATQKPTVVYLVKKMGKLKESDGSKTRPLCPAPKCEESHACFDDTAVCCGKYCCAKGTVCLNVQEETCVKESPKTAKCHLEICKKGHECPHPGVSMCCTGGEVCCKAGTTCTADSPAKCRKLSALEIITQRPQPQVPKQSREIRSEEDLTKDTPANYLPPPASRIPTRVVPDSWVAPVKQEKKKKEQKKNSKATKERSKAFVVPVAATSVTTSKVREAHDRSKAHVDTGSTHIDVVDRTHFVSFLDDSSPTTQSITVMTSKGTMRELPAPDTQYIVPELPHSPPALKLDHVLPDSVGSQRPVIDADGNESPTAVVDTKTLMKHKYPAIKADVAAEKAKAQLMAAKIAEMVMPDKKPDAKALQAVIKAAPSARQALPLDRRVCHGDKCCDLEEDGCRLFDPKEEPHNATTWTRTRTYVLRSHEGNEEQIDVTEIVKAEWLANGKLQVKRQRHRLVTNLGDPNSAAAKKAVAQDNEMYAKALQKEAELQKQQEKKVVIRARKLKTLIGDVATSSISALNQGPKSGISSRQKDQKLLQDLSTSKAAEPLHANVGNSPLTTHTAKEFEEQKNRLNRIVKTIDHNTHSVRYGSLALPVFEAKKSDAIKKLSESRR